MVLPTGGFKSNQWSKTKHKNKKHTCFVLGHFIKRRQMSSISDEQIKHECM